MCSAAAAACSNPHQYAPHLQQSAGCLILQTGCTTLDASSARLAILERCENTVFSSVTDISRVMQDSTSTSPGGRRCRAAIGSHCRNSCCCVLTMQKQSYVGGELQMCMIGHTMPQHMLSPGSMMHALNKTLSTRPLNETVTHYSKAFGCCFHNSSVLKQYAMYVDACNAYAERLRRFFQSHSSHNMQSLYVHLCIYHKN
jgi:hypothetical protein